MGEMWYSQGHEGDEDGRDEVELHRDGQEPRPRHALKHATTLTTMPMVQLPITLSYAKPNVSTQRDSLQKYVFVLLGTMSDYLSNGRPL